MTDTIKSGMFVMPIHDPQKPYVQMIDEDIELAVKCDELGFDTFWVGEHHSSTYENIVSPEIFLGKVLGLTQKIRVGPAPVCLAYHNPVHVANRLAFMDHLSHGRLNVCFGPGAVPTDLEAFNVEPPEIGRRVAEAKVQAYETIQRSRKLQGADPVLRTRLSLIKNSKVFPP